MQQPSMASWRGATFIGGGFLYLNQRSDITRETVNGEAVILDRRSQQIHQLNETASFIWDRCDGTMSVPDIIALVTERFDVNSDVAAADVGKTVEELRNLGLLIVHK